VWSAAWLLSGWPPNRAALPAFAAAFVLTEAAAWGHRRRLARQLGAGLRHGSVDSHLLPFGLALLGLLPFAAAPYLGLPARFPLVHLPAAALKIVCGLLASWAWGTMLTVSVIDRVRPDEVEEQPGRLGAGEVIGVVERTLAFALMLVQAPTAVAIGIAAKSAVRFPEFEDQAFAEYFLVGTLTSIGVGIAAAILSAL
jgi:hypothetical protein